MFPCANSHYATSQNLLPVYAQITHLLHDLNMDNCEIMTDTMLSTKSPRRRVDKHAAHMCKWSRVSSHWDASISRLISGRGGVSPAAYIYTKPAHSIHLLAKRHNDILIHVLAKRQMMQNSAASRASLLTSFYDRYRHRLYSTSLSIKPYPTAQKIVLLK